MDEVKHKKAKIWTRECKKCHSVLTINNDDCFWQEFGTYSQKLYICPECGCVVVVQTLGDRSLHVNIDKRYYQYSQQSLTK